MRTWQLSLFLTMRVSLRGGLEGRISAIRTKNRVYLGKVADDYRRVWYATDFQIDGRPTWWPLAAIQPDDTAELQPPLGNVPRSHTADLQNRPP